MPKNIGILEMIFSEEELKKFKFVWGQYHLASTKVLRPDGNGLLMVKDLRVVWDVLYSGVYNHTNTVLIDHFPMVTFINPTWTCLYPTKFKFGDCTDYFLLDIFWPLLQKLSCAIDVRRFLSINTPKWSLKNYFLDQRKYAQTYALLNREYHVTRVSMPMHSILDYSDYEIRWMEKHLVSTIPPIGDPSFTEPHIEKIALHLLSPGFRVPNVLEFVNKVREIRDTSSKFHLTPLDTCNRDIIVDEDRSKLTCSNLNCKLCPY
jgi:hypothetical protein